MNFNFFHCSIMPETTIEPHEVLSPLPKRLWPQNQKKSQEVRKKKNVSSEDSKKSQNNIKVFAKWVEGTSVKYWPGVIKHQPDIPEDKYLIIFDDGYEKIVKKEDVIRADALTPGNLITFFCI